ncbi:MAG: septum formation initiator family protein [Azospirillum sp.]|nr:septum formation initiator family protein [Azospirillum sp.]
MIALDLILPRIRYALARVGRMVVGPVIGSCIVGYFAFYAVQGDRGLYALKHLQGEVEEAKVTFADVEAERERLARRAKLLRPDSLDLDMLDERARAMLNYSRPDEIILFFPKDDRPNQTVATITPTAGH